MADGVTQTRAFAQLYRELQSISGQMRDYALDGNWLLVSELESKRQDVLANLPKQAGALDQVENARAILGELLETNDQLVKLGEAARKDLADQLRGLNRSKQVANDYKKHASIP